MSANPPSVVLQNGAKALYEGRPVVIESILDLNLIQVRDLATDELLQIKIQYLSPPPKKADSRIVLTTAKASQDTENRKTIIEQLRNNPYRTREDVEKVAAEFRISTSTL